MYSLLIIDSSNPFHYWEDLAEGIRYDNLTKTEADNLISLSLERNFSVIIQRDIKEE